MDDIKGILGRLSLAEDAKRQAGASVDAIKAELAAAAAKKGLPANVFHTDGQTGFVLIPEGGLWKGPVNRL